MVFNVPQFIGIEDKIVGPLTAKQLGWFGLAGVILLILWGLLDISAFFMSAVVVIGLALALGFYRPYNQSLLEFLSSSVFFVLRPKDYVWRRYYDNINTKTKAPEKKIEKALENKKIISSSKLDELSEILDKNKQL